MHDGRFIPYVWDSAHIQGLFIIHKILVFFYRLPTYLKVTLEPFENFLKNYKGNTLLPWRGILWYFFVDICSGFFHKTPLCHSLPWLCTCCCWGSNFMGSCVGADLVCPMIGWLVWDVALHLFLAFCVRCPVVGGVTMRQICGVPCRICGQLVTMASLKCCWSSAVINAISSKVGVWEYAAHSSSSFTALCAGTFCYWCE